MTTANVYGALAERLGFADSVRFRRILEFLMTPEQARLAVELPALPDELAQKVGLDVATVNRELDRLYRKGVVFPRNFETGENPRFARSVTQLHDASQTALRLDTVRHRDLFALWEDFATNEWDERRAHEWAREATPSGRIIPNYKSIQNIPGILPYEDPREMLKAMNLIAVVSCSCRQRKEATGHRCGRTHDANCFQFNRGAEYAIWRGTGTRLSLDGALEMLDETEEDGLVHTWGNTSSMARTVMCNCCPDCCMVLQPLLRFHMPGTVHYAKSRFEASVDQDTCTGCQTCVDRCPFEAIEMVKPEGSRKFKALVNAEKCMGCGVCIIGCEDEALSMKMVRPVEHIPAAS